MTAQLHFDSAELLDQASNYIKAAPTGERNTRLMNATIFLSALSKQDDRLDKEQVTEVLKRAAMENGLPEREVSQVIENWSRLTSETLEPSVFVEQAKEIGLALTMVEI